MNVTNILVLYQQINFRLRGFPTGNDVMVFPIQLFTELVFLLLEYVHLKKMYNFIFWRNLSKRSPYFILYYNVTCILY